MPREIESELEWLAQVRDRAGLRPVAGGHAELDGLAKILVKTGSLKHPRKMMQFYGAKMKLVKPDREIRSIGKDLLSALNNFLISPVHRQVVLDENLELISIQTNKLSGGAVLVVAVTGNLRKIAMKDKK